MSTHNTTLNIRGPAGVSTIRLNTANILTISSSIQCQGNIVDAQFTGNIMFPEHIRDGVLYIQDGVLKTSSISEYQGGIVLPANVSGSNVTIADTFGTELVYIDSSTFRVDGTLYVTGSSTISGENVSIEANYGIRAAQFLTASDERLKRDILPVTQEEKEGLRESIRSLDIKRWNDVWTGRQRLGLIADDVERVFPSAVHRVRGIVPLQTGGTATYDYDSCSYMLPSHGLSDGERITYIVQSEHKEHMDRIKVIDDSRFELVDDGRCDWSVIHVQGKVVDDLKTIDYDVLCIGLIAALQKMV